MQRGGVAFPGNCRRYYMNICGVLSLLNPSGLNEDKAEHFSKQVILRVVILIFEPASNWKKNGDRKENIY